MNQQEYLLIKNYMLECMDHSAHDQEHVHRVLYHALDIAQTEKNVNYDVSGVTGIARTLLYKGQIMEPLYSLLPNGSVSNGENDTHSSFLQEYKYKLEKIYSFFYTKRGQTLAQSRQKSAISFYENLLQELNTTYLHGEKELTKFIQ